MTFPIPGTLEHEHREIHEALDRAALSGGETGRAANAVIQILHPHFLKEEEYALPPLGLLVQLAQGKVTRTLRDVIPLSDRLKKELPAMEEEHREIARLLNVLALAAGDEGKPEAEQLAEKIVFHARNEEEVLYPAAILVGEYVKQVLK